ncbi:MAG: PLP-dependent aminotransferase family protein [Thermoplasmatota archaeon]
MDLKPLYSRVAQAMKASEIRELLKLTEQPDVISFAGGLPNPQSFPVEEVQEATARVFADHSQRALQYSTTEGVTELREAIADYLGKDGLAFHPDQVLVTNGSQQGLDLLGRVMLDPGDTVVTSNPTYLGALQAFNTYGCGYAAADSDDDGLIPDSLDEVLTGLRKEGTRAKFLYLVPTFQNPSGTVIPEARRRKILDLAHEHDLLVVEDDPYGKLRFDGDPVPTMYSMDKDEGRVLYFGTFSKILVPGFRLAWSVGPQDLVRKMVIAKQSVDLCTNAFTQFVAADMLGSGTIERHLPKIIDLYRGKRDVMFRAIDEHFPGEQDGVHLTRSQGGMFTWAEMPQGIDCVQMLEEAVKLKVAYVPGKPFFPSKDPQVGLNTMRLNFTHATDASIATGIERLGGVMQRTLAAAKVAA